MWRKVGLPTHTHTHECVSKHSENLHPTNDTFDIVIVYLKLIHFRTGIFTISQNKDIAFFFLRIPMSIWKDGACALSLCKYPGIKQWFNLLGVLWLVNTEKTIFPFPFTLNGIWSWWQFSFRFLNKWNYIRCKIILALYIHQFLMSWW